MRGTCISAGQRPDYQFHVENYGHPSKFGFKDVINEWKAEKWDPEALIALYKRAGAKYFFAAWPTTTTTSTCGTRSTSRGTRVARRARRRTSSAAGRRRPREAGLRFGVSVHGGHAWAWLRVAQGADPTGPLAGVPYDGGLTKADGKGKWWDGLDPQDLYAQYHARGRLRLELSARRAGNGVRLRTRPTSEKFFNRTIDLIDKYQPDLLYFDDTVLPF